MIVLLGIMEIDYFHTGYSLKKTITGASSLECPSKLICQATESLQSSVHGFHLTKVHSLCLRTIKYRFNQSYSVLEKRKMLGKAVSGAQTFSQCPVV